LILCIDKDDDLGSKTGVETPLIGVDPNLDAATRLALADPEEADANAMFGAIKLCKELQEKHPDERFQVATITGSKMGGVDSDRKLIRELGRVLELEDPSEVILVTDGYADEELIPILQSRIPILSIHHVVVKHSERIEETYAVVFRYLRMLVEDPYYSRVTLGVPGILLLLFGFLIASNQVERAGTAVTFVMGILLILKGFSLDEKLAELRPRLPPPERWINITSTGIGGIVFLVGVIQGVNYAWSIIPLPIMPFWELSYWASNAADLLGAFTIQAANMISLGIAISIMGDAVSSLVQERDYSKIWGNIIGLVFLFWMRPIVIEAAKILRNPEIKVTFTSPLIVYTVLGALNIIVLVAFIYKREGREFFSRSN